MRDGNAPAFRPELSGRVVPAGVQRRPFDGPAPTLTVPVTVVAVSKQSSPYLDRGACRHPWITASRVRRSDGPSRSTTPASVGETPRSKLDPVPLAGDWREASAPVRGTPSKLRALRFGNIRSRWRPTLYRGAWPWQSRERGAFPPIRACRTDPTVASTGSASMKCNAYAEAIPRIKEIVSRNRSC